MRLRCDLELLPKFGILDRLLIGCAPAILPPIVDPAGNSVAQIDAVGMKIDLARSLQCLEALDRGHEFHAIVGRQRFSTRQFLFAGA